MWHKQAHRAGEIRKTEEDLISELAKLRRENQELRDTNELLKAASVFSPRILGGVSPKPANHGRFLRVNARIMCFYRACCYRMVPLRMEMSGW
ncbi:hypothetical protein HMPREF0578_0764 [Mobiluncus mulieris 28-1]|nr:hypothetical protein HMPREF0578_0764 [Mobiluncus mulieris 28-1]